MEYKNLKFQGDVNIEKRTIEGYAAIFNNVDQGGDMIRPGAFEKTIAERFTAGKIKTMYNHSDLIGKPDVLKEDEKGLFTASSISATPRGDEVLTLVKDGVLTDMSIGYNTMNFNSIKSAGRELTELRLYEVSFVDWGMNELAEITGIKSISRLVDMAYRSGVTLDFATIDLLRTTIKSLQSLVGEESKGRSSAINIVMGELGPDVSTTLVDVTEWCRTKNF